MSPLLCEAGVKEKVIVQVREQVLALIAVDVLGILPYCDGLLYASCPPVTFLYYYPSTVPIYHMVLLDHLMRDG